MTRRDTIAAISTAPGRAAIGVVRLSGPSLAETGRVLTGLTLEPRAATRAAFRDAEGAAIDEGIALYFRAPRSYTGEDVLELHGHGGAVVLRRLLERCVQLGARVAEPGEFTQRAFLNGKLDLVQAESVIDLIDATTVQAARSAMRSLQGAFSSAIQGLSSQVVELRALVEATLDFPEEEIDVLDSAEARARLQGIRGALEDLLEAARQGSLLREGMHVVLAGRPNVGKSSLLNRLAGDDIAIVTEIPGTTRDAIRETIDIDGIPVHVIDTAGLRESGDPVERLGVDRAWRAIERADVVVHLTDASRNESGQDAAILERVPAGVPRLTVFNKIDLLAREPALERRGREISVWLSAKTGAGLELLREALLSCVGWQGHAEGVYLARERHLNALHRTKACLEAAETQRAVELFAEELRLAHEALCSVTGEFTSDDLLGEIFQRFCIGK